MNIIAEFLGNGIIYTSKNHHKWNQGHAIERIFSVYWKYTSSTYPGLKDLYSRKVQ